MPQRRKFTWQRVCELREWYAQYKAIPSLHEIARQEGVRPSVIRDLCEWRTYKKDDTPVDIDELAETALKNCLTWNQERV